MPNEAFTVYVTKDALSRGITIAELGPDASTDGHAAKFVIRPSGMEGIREWLTVRDGEYFSDLPSAVADAEERRVRKLAALEAQIAAIRAIDLTKPVEG